MATVYARQTALHNVSGRLDYISSAQRQENLLGYFDGAADQLQGQYWETLVQESRQSFAQHGEHTKKAVEGRELVVKLSNSLLDNLSPRQVCKVLAISFEQTYHRPAAVALHYNRSKSNLHAHLVYSERLLLPEPATKVAPRNLFFDEEGKRRYKRKEILDEAGELRPGCRIVPKGAVYERRCFGPALPQFHLKTWLASAKKEWLLPLLNGLLKGDEQYQLFDYRSGKLPQQHVGKNLRPDQQATVQEYNNLVREYNKAVEAGDISLDAAEDVQERVLTSPDRYNALERELQALTAPETAPETPVRPQTSMHSEVTLKSRKNAPAASQRQSVRDVLQKYQYQRPVLPSPQELGERIYSLAMTVHPDLTERERTEGVASIVEAIETRTDTEALMRYVETLPGKEAREILEALQAILDERYHIRPYDDLEL